MLLASIFLLNVHRAQHCFIFNLLCPPDHCAFVALFFLYVTFRIGDRDEKGAWKQVRNAVSADFRLEFLAHTSSFITPREMDSARDTLLLDSLSKACDLSVTHFQNLSLHAHQ